MFRRPIEIVEDYLIEGEIEILRAEPNVVAWVLDQWVDFLAAVIILFLVVTAWDSSVTLIGGLMLLVLGIQLVIRGLKRWYTVYLLTDLRALRASGVLRRDYEWISWGRVTDVAVHRSLSDRIIGTATVQIQSANERSGFKAMDDVPNPTTFALTITEMIRTSPDSARTAPTADPGVGRSGSPRRQ